MYVAEVETSELTRLDMMCAGDGRAGDFRKRAGACNGWVCREQVGQRAIASYSGI